MISALKPIAGLLLAAMLVLTGQSMVLARGAAAATGQIEICIGADIVTVYVDENGQPTQAPHICPDCVLSFAEAPPVLDAALPQAVGTVLYRLPQLQSDIPSAETAHFWSRAPPISA